ncbi:MAG: succinate dehydrogenase, cytochrome b556 subunit [Pseudoprimorskyibacter sp.]|nr:succinate dehydrogenase, cytochrome b556 subunit [Pseudoprimorskyibacter sp.]
MADVNRGGRPLSPHLQVYRPQWTSMSSILVRLTGIGCLLLMPLIVIWLLAASSSANGFGIINGVLTSWLGSLIMLGGVWALTYHMLGRLRHVIWDFGFLVNVPASEKMAYAMVITATLVTGLVALFQFGVIQ